MLNHGAILAGRYRIDRKIGQGELGEIYLAEDLARQAPVAVKVLRAGLAEDPEFARQFRGQAARLARLDLPNVMRFYGFFRKGSLAFTVNEYVPGETLRRRLAEAGGALALPEATAVFEQVANALAAAHGQGIIHGDVKPGNILLHAGAASLFDFGLVRAVQNAALSPAAAGTPFYMSPEQLLGRDVDGRTDVYSLAVVLYEMVSGRRPFDGERGAGTTVWERLLDEHVNHAPLDPRYHAPELPAAAAEALLRGLAKSPAARWPDAASFASAWQRAVGPELAVARAAQPAGTAGPAGTGIASRGDGAGQPGHRAAFPAGAAAAAGALAGHAAGAAQARAGEGASRGAPGDAAEAGRRPDGVATPQPRPAPWPGAVDGMEEAGAGLAYAGGAQAADRAPAGRPAAAGAGAAAGALAAGAGASALRTANAGAGASSRASGTAAAQAGPGHTTPRAGAASEAASSARTATAYRPAASVPAPPFGPGGASPVGAAVAPARGAAWPPNGRVLAAVLAATAAGLLLAVGLLLSRGANAGEGPAAIRPRDPAAIVARTASPTRAPATATGSPSAGIFSPLAGAFDWLPGQGPRWTPPPVGPGSEAGSATPTAPAGGPFAVARTGVNVRSGPGTVYAVVGALSAGTRAPIVGRTAAGDWWQICCVNGVSTGWISAAVVSPAGALDSVPVVAVPAAQPPTATTQPSATAPPPTVPPPTATPRPPTATAVPPTATPRPPTATTAPPAALLVPTNCPAGPQAAFAALAGRPAPTGEPLGCPVTAAGDTHFSHQWFEHGQMVYRYDLKLIYVLYSDGTWAAYPDTYVEGQPWQLNTYTPPSGLSQPIKGFDRVWERAEVRSRLGWATAGELGLIPGQAEQFANGLALWLGDARFARPYYALFADGKWAGF